MNSDSFTNENELNDELIIDEINDLSNDNNDTENPSNSLGHFYICVSSNETVSSFWDKTETAAVCRFGGQKSDSNRWTTRVSSYDTLDVGYAYQRSAQTAYLYTIKLYYNNSGSSSWLPYWFTSTSTWIPTTGLLTEYVTRRNDTTSTASGIAMVEYITDTGAMTFWTSTSKSTLIYSYNVKPLGGPAHILNMTSNTGLFAFSINDDFKSLVYNDCRYLNLPRRYSYDIKISGMEDSKCFAYWNSNGTIKRQIIDKDSVMLHINSSTNQGHDNYTLGGYKYDFFGAVCSNNATSSKMNSLIDITRFEIQIRNSSGDWTWTTGSYVNYLDDGTTWTTYPDSLRGETRTAETIYCSTFFSDNWKNSTSDFQNLLNSGYHIAWTNNDDKTKQYTYLGATAKAIVTNNSAYAVDSAALDLSSYMNSSIGDFTTQHDSNPEHYYIRPCFKIQNNSSNNIEIYGSNRSITSASISKENWAWAPANDNSYNVCIKNLESSSMKITISLDDSINKNSLSRIVEVTLAPNEVYTYGTTKFAVNQNFIVTSEPVASSTNKIRVNGEWKDAQAKVYISGAWKDCTAYVWKNGAWHQTS